MILPSLQLRSIAPRLLATTLLFALAGSAYAGGDPAAGANKAKPCSACHSNAIQDQQYPRLGGQYADYLSRALHEYKTGERKNPTMAGMAAPLSDQDIEDIAAYYASLPGKLHDLSHLKKK